MGASLKVETQGISDDWSRANGDYTVKQRGDLGEDRLRSAMLHLAPLDTPAGNDPCPPQIVTRGPAGAFSFIGQGGTIYCPETDSEMSAEQASEVAFGRAGTAPPPPLPPAVATEPRSPTVARPIRKRRFGWRGGIVLFLSLCFLIGAIVMAFGVASMKNRGVSGDDILAAITIGGALAICAALLFALALKARRNEYFDAHGTPVDKDGSALTFVAMGQALGDYDDGDDGFDGIDFD